jgi:hypothetical protein
MSLFTHNPVACEGFELRDYLESLGFKVKQNEDLINIEREIIIIILDLSKIRKLEYAKDYTHILTDSLSKFGIPTIILVDYRNIDLCDELNRANEIFMNIPEFKEWLSSNKSHSAYPNPIIKMINQFEEDLKITTCLSSRIRYRSLIKKEIADSLNNNN